MNWLESRAEEVRIEVDLIVEETGSFAGEETKRNYLLLAERGYDHWTCRERGMLNTADTLLARSRAAEVTDPESAAKWKRHAMRLWKAYEHGHPMRDALGLRTVA